MEKASFMEQQRTSLERRSTAPNGRTLRRELGQVQHMRRSMDSIGIRIGLLLLSMYWTMQVLFKFS